MRAWVRDLWILSHADLFSIPTFLHVLRTYASSCIPSGQLTRSILNIPQRSTIPNIFFILVRTLHQFLSGCQVHTLKTNTMDRYMYALAYLRDINVPMLVEAGQLMIFAVHIQETHKEQQHSKQCGVFPTLFLCWRYLELLPGHTRLRALWKRGS